LGYRKGVPFRADAQDPGLGEFDRFLRIYDNGLRVTVKDAALSVEGNDVSIKFPLAGLGNPQIYFDRNSHVHGELAAGRQHLGGHWSLNPNKIEVLMKKFNTFIFDVRALLFRWSLVFCANELSQYSPRGWRSSQSRQRPARRAQRAKTRKVGAQIIEGTKEYIGAAA